MKSAPHSASNTVRVEAVQSLLARLERGDVEIVRCGPIAEDRAPGELKQVGYGDPMLVGYRAHGVEKQVVLHTMAPNWFGHDRRSDRAALVLLAADTFPEVPRHVGMIDVGAFDGAGELVSLAGDGEFWLLTEYAEGALYARDLREVERRREASVLDLERASALARYLADLHREPAAGAPELYQRALRDVIGSGEGIMGLVDSYPADGPIAAPRLTRIEQKAIEYRARLRSRSTRLRRTHGDFHPYNVLFRDGTDFSVLDASRGSVGDPADDLAALSINYVFGALVHPEAAAKGFAPLWSTFWDAYLGARGDQEALAVIPLFFAWRALVVASPIWYPALTASTRDDLIGFAERLLEQGACDPAAIGDWLRGLPIAP